MLLLYWTAGGSTCCDWNFHCHKSCMNKTIISYFMLFSGIRIQTLNRIIPLLG